jgi:hypothetical protein
MNSFNFDRELAEPYDPVPHDRAFRDRIMKRPGAKAAYDALAEQYAALDAVLVAREGPD